MTPGSFSLSQASSSSSETFYSNAKRLIFARKVLHLASRVLKVRVFGARRKWPIANKWFLDESVKQLTVNALPNPWYSGDHYKDVENI